MNPKINQAIATLKEILVHHPVTLGFSGGKDSSVCAVLIVEAAKQLIESDQKVMPIFFMHSDTEIENPAVSSCAKNEIRKIEAFAASHNLPLRVMIGHPNLASSFAMRVIGSGKLAVYPGDKQDCTQEYKITPQNRLRALVKKEIEAITDRAPVIMTGVRFEESAQREAKMKARGDNAEEMIVNKDGQLYLAPIADWTTADVFGLLQIAGEGVIDTYSDFEDVESLYADAAPSSCPVIGDELLGDVKASRGGCGSRFGCWACTYVGSSDKSMVNLITNEPETYGFMKHLNAIQAWLSAIRYDYTSRSWLPRSINDAGFIRIQPDLYGPKQIEDLFRFVVTADVVEQEAAAALNQAPRFRTIDEQKLIGIDASWSQLGFFPPFHAIKVYKDIVEKGERFFAPKINAFPRVPRPAARFAFIGNDWMDENISAKALLSLGEHRFVGGLDSTAELFVSETNDCAQSINTDTAFSVDEEGAALFMDLEADRMIASHHDTWSSKDVWNRDITEGYKFYLRMGIISLAKGSQESVAFKILRRTYFRDSLGLCGPDADVRGLLAQSISQSEMDNVMREHKKATMAEIDAVNAFQAWLNTDKGRVYQRTVDLSELKERTELIVSRIIQSEAYLAYATAQKDSSIFDGVDYRAFLALAKDELTKLSRAWENDVDAMRVIEQQRAGMFQKATDFLAGKDVKAPSGWFTLSLLRQFASDTATIQRIAGSWEFQANHVMFEEQSDLFAA